MSVCLHLNPLKEQARRCAQRVFVLKFSMYQLSHSLLDQKCVFFSAKEDEYGDMYDMLVNCLYHIPLRKKNEPTICTQKDDLGAYV